MTHSYLLGYTSLDEELTIERLNVEGMIPTWMTGTLLRNGPAKFEVGGEQFRHWFDGFAMLHRFSFQDGAVSYGNKFLRSDAYTSSIKEGHITFGQFATDPCKAIFKGMMTASVNANVSINKIAGEYVAMTETPLPIAFDPRTLDTLGVVNYDDQVTGHHGSAHPHHDPFKHMTVSYLLQFGPESLFQVYGIKDNEHRRILIGSYPELEPPYIHSFGITEHYVIIAEFPYRVFPLSFMTSGKPFIENYTWRPDESTQFIVMSKEDGQIVGRYEVDACFSFHHINAFERGDELVVDLSAYSSAASIDLLYLDRLRDAAIHPQPSNTEASEGVFRRYRLPLHGSTVKTETLTTQSIELPTINYAAYNARTYSVAYGISTDKQRVESFSNQLLRVNTETGDTQTWSQEGCYPGEPIFAAAPDAKAEDDGVILSVVLNAPKNNSFLLVLDAHSFSEIGRAEVPHHIPFGFHGQYHRNV